jgi:hypothetical protein
MQKPSDAKRDEKSYFLATYDNVIIQNKCNENE